MLRRLEMMSGLLTGIAGLAGPGYALCGPMGSTTAESETTIGSVTVTTAIGHGSTTPAEQGVLPVTMLFLTAALLCAVGVVVGAYLHVRHSDPVGLALLCVATALLWGETILGAASIGVFLAPAALLALSTASVGVVAGSRRAAGG
jgi:hypothetical protein